MHPQTVDCLKPGPEPCSGKAEYKSNWGTRLRYKCPKCHYVTQVETKLGKALSYVRIFKIVTSVFTGAGVVTAATWGVKKVCQMAQDPHEVVEQMTEVHKVVRETVTETVTKMTGRVRPPAPPLAEAKKLAAVVSNSRETVASGKLERTS